jgi:predicted ABC-type transport system involved in lysophospholipase L1 biosynthesis ATPase subunit
LIVVTHNRSLAQRADRVLQLEDGRLVDTDVAGALA